MHFRLIKALRMIYSRGRFFYSYIHFLPIMIILLFICLRKAGAMQDLIKKPLPAPELLVSYITLVM